MDSVELVRAYRMHKKMLAYPHLLEEMRALFLEALTERGVISPEEIEHQAREKLAQEGLPPGEEVLREYVHALTDLYFANNFTWQEIEDYINLARKKDAFRDLHKVINMEGATSAEIQKTLKDFCQIPQGDLFISPDEAEGARVGLISQFISNQLPFIGVAKHHITIRDVDEMLDHTFGNLRRPGKIGGKAAGMLLAYKILLPRLQARDPELEERVVIPESYYFNSGVFSDFVDYNKLYRFHTQKYKQRETIEEEYQKMAQLFDQASFPPDVVDSFRDFLEEVGEHPLILRSSSLLEDNFGYAFSGKYDSIFLTNQGDLETRLEGFIRGLKRVHMSTYAPAPIIYRRDHNLLDFDERMCVLVQKVVGRRFGDYFFPFCAGVAYSQNMFTWTPRIRKEEGLVRLVLGLGTRAVDRFVGDYPRMIPLSHPALRPEVGAQQIRKYSQNMVDLLNLNSGRLETIPWMDLVKQIQLPDLFYAVALLQDGHLAPPMFKGQAVDPHQACLTFDNLLTKTPFVRLMKKILQNLEKAYGRPVDVEFAWDQDQLYLLQCRSLPVRAEVGKVALPEDIPPEQVLFTNDQAVGSYLVADLEYIVYVNPKAYGRLETYEEKMAIGRAVSRINRRLEGKRYALLGPGRWGSNDINLGVRVGYEDINQTLILGEIAFEEEGSTPEVSHGTHFFNDLVEADIIPLALYPDQPEAVFNEEFLLKAPNELTALDPGLDPYTGVVRVIHVPSATRGRLLQFVQDGAQQKGLGFFARPEEEAGS